MAAPEGVDLALIRQAKLQAGWQKDSDPASIFLLTLGGLLAQGAVRLTRRGSPLSSIEDRGTPIGWKDDQYAYLIPQVTRVEVCRALRVENREFSWSARALNDALLKGGYLVPDTDGRNDVVFVSPGHRGRVLKIPLEALGIATADTTSESSGDESGDRATAPESSATSGGSLQGSGGRSPQSPVLETTDHSYGPPTGDDQ